MKASFLLYELQTLQQGLEREAGGAYISGRIFKTVFYGFIAVVFC